MPYKDPERRKEFKREYNRRYREENRDYYVEYRKKWIKNRPGLEYKYGMRRKDVALKLRANRMLVYAVKTGKIIRPEVCSKCLRAGKIDGHHPDYNEPLSVIWLCGKCHHSLHKLIRDAEKEKSK